MVRAKLVLDQMEATMDMVAVTLKILASGTKFSGGISHECLPSPRLTQYEMMHTAARLTVCRGGLAAVLP